MLGTFRLDNCKVFGVLAARFHFVFLEVNKDDSSSINCFLTSCFLLDKLLLQKQPLSSPEKVHCFRKKHSLLRKRPLSFQLNLLFAVFSRNTIFKTFKLTQLNSIVQCELF